MAAPRKAQAEGQHWQPGPLLEWAGVPWLAGPRQQLAQARVEGHMPHALLVHGTERSGHSTLAVWAAQLVLCERPGSEPCGQCNSCVLFLAGNHPDFHFIELEEKASQVKIDQVRGLCSTLAMRSYLGGAKVGLVDPADKMNVNANNALLKTLEEPPEDTLVILCASRLDRLARTVTSRCQRLHVRSPEPGPALAWLEARGRRPDWPGLLALAAGAPLRALELAEAGAGELSAEMEEALAGSDGARFDPLWLADRWSKDRPGDRLAWLEQWLESVIRRLAGLSDAVNNNRDNRLSSAAAGLNMTTAFELLDRVREARVLHEGSLNTLLLFEDLLVGFAEAFAGRRALRPENRT